MSLILVGWSPGLLSLNEPGKILEVETYVRKLAAFDTRWTFFVIKWRPSEEDLGRLIFALRHRSQEWVHTVLFKSVRESAVWLFRPRKPGTAALTAPANYAEAILQLLSAVTGTASDTLKGEPLQFLRQNVHQLLERDVLGPLTSQAMRTADPIERDLMAALTPLSRLVHIRGISIAQQVCQTFVNTGISRAEHMPTEGIQELLNDVSNLVALSREIRHCRKAAMIQVPTMRPSAIPSRRSLFALN
jgi:hypothetical protein